MCSHNTTFTISGRNYRVIACSVKGNNKADNQDSYGIFADENQLIVVVADGLGSAELSNIGSKMAVDAAIEVLSSKVDVDSLSKRVFDVWAEKIGPQISRYDTTCKFVKLTGDNVIYGGIGDGWIVIKDQKGCTELVADNLFTNQTDSILSDDLESKFVVKSFKNDTVENILMATDGFSEDFQKERIIPFLESAHEQIMANHEAFRKDMGTFLADWPVKTNEDDKTVIIIQGE